MLPSLKDISLRDGLKVKNNRTGLIGRLKRRYKNDFYWDVYDGKDRIASQVTPNMIAADYQLHVDLEDHFQSIQNDQIFKVIQIDNLLVCLKNLQSGDKTNCLPYHLFVSYLPLDDDDDRLHSSFPASIKNETSMPHLFAGYSEQPSADEQSKNFSPATTESSSPLSTNWTLTLFDENERYSVRRINNGEVFVVIGEYVNKSNEPDYQIRRILYNTASEVLGSDGTHIPGSIWRSKLYEQFHLIVKAGDVLQSRTADKNDLDYHRYRVIEIQNGTICCRDEKTDQPRYFPSSCLFELCKFDKEPPVTLPLKLSYEKKKWIHPYFYTKDTPHYYEAYYYIYTDDEEYYLYNFKNASYVKAIGEFKGAEFDPRLVLQDAQNKNVFFDDGKDEPGSFSKNLLFYLNHGSYPVVSPEFQPTIGPNEILQLRDYETPLHFKVVDVTPDDVTMEEITPNCLIGQVKHLTYQATIKIDRSQVFKYFKYDHKLEKEITAMENNIAKQNQNLEKDKSMKKNDNLPKIPNLCAECQHIRCVSEIRPFLFHVCTHPNKILKPKESPPFLFVEPSQEPPEQCGFRQIQKQENEKKDEQPQIVNNTTPQTESSQLSIFKQMVEGLKFDLKPYQRYSKPVELVDGKDIVRKDVLLANKHGSSSSTNPCPKITCPETPKIVYRKKDKTAPPPQNFYYLHNYICWEGQPSFVVLHSLLPETFPKILCVNQNTFNTEWELVETMEPTELHKKTTQKNDEVHQNECANSNDENDVINRTQFYKNIREIIKPHIQKVGIPGAHAEGGALYTGCDDIPIKQPNDTDDEATELQAGRYIESQYKKVERLQRKITKLLEYKRGAVNTFDLLISTSNQHEKRLCLIEENLQDCLNKLADFENQNNDDEEIDEDDDVENDMEEESISAEEQQQIEEVKNLIRRAQQHGMPSRKEGKRLLSLTNAGLILFVLFFIFLAFFGEKLF